jgi:hypothetical protein
MNETLEILETFFRDAGIPAICNEKHECFGRLPMPYPGYNGSVVSSPVYAILDTLLLGRMRSITVEITMDKEARVKAKCTCGIEAYFDLYRPDSLSSMLEWASEHLEQRPHWVKIGDAARI